MVCWRPRAFSAAPAPRPMGLLRAVGSLLATAAHARIARAGAQRQPMACFNGEPSVAGSVERSAVDTAVYTGGSVTDFVAYLLVSPTRSSIAGSTARSRLSEVVAFHNGEVTGVEAPQETALLRPWRVADAISHPSAKAARSVGQRVSKASGFRARLAALRDSATVAPPDGADDGDVLDEMWFSLDSLTYAHVEFVNPLDPSRRAKVLALVDTGSTECDLRQSFIDALGLRLDGSGRSSVFETAAGLTMETQTYRAVVRVGDREGSVRVTPTDDEEEGRRGESGPVADDVDKEFGFDANTDDAVLGFEALETLNLLVDCRRRELVAATPQSRGGAAHGRLATSMHVRVEFQNPADRKRSTKVHAMVDTGCTDVDIRQSAIDALGLIVDPTEGRAQFETAAGITIDAPIYRAVVRAVGREAVVRVSPTEEAEDSSDNDEADEALLGHDAIAALGLLVDCRGRRLLVG